MDLPNRLKVDMDNDYYSDDSDYDDDYMQTFTVKKQFTTIKSPPEKLTIPRLEEAREQESIIDEGNYRTPILKNNADPISTAKQVRHLYNRVRLIEDELQAQSNRQILIIGVLSVYLVTRGVSWMFK